MTFSGPYRSAARRYSCANGPPQQLILLTERLTGLIAEQLRAFEARRPHDAAANAEETSRLANLYRHESLKLKADPNALDGAPAELREKLVTVTRAFDAVLARHGRAVEAAKTITEGLIRFSAGLEHQDDLIEDLYAALEQA